MKWRLYHLQHGLCDLTPWWRNEGSQAVDWKQNERYETPQQVWKPLTRQTSYWKNKCVHSSQPSSLRILVVTRRSYSELNNSPFRSWLGRTEGETHTREADGSGSHTSTTIPTEPGFMQRSRGNQINENLPEKLQYTIKHKLNQVIPFKSIRSHTASNTVFGKPSHWDRADKTGVIRNHMWGSHTWRPEAGPRVYSMGKQPGKVCTLQKANFTRTAGMCGGRLRRQHSSTHIHNWQSRGNVWRSSSSNDGEASTGPERGLLMALIMIIER